MSELIKAILWLALAFWLYGVWHRASPETHRAALHAWQWSVQWLDRFLATHPITNK